jgi:serine/threonine-protein kinase
VIQDRYRILDVVASGGMGVVYRGERIQLGRPVAIKFLHPWVASEQSFLQRFDVEAQAMSRLNHPNCVSVIDFGVHEVPFLVMDFVAGRSLRFVIENEKLPPARVLGLGRQILSGLSHAHAQGIVHRDLKPENIVVTDSPGLVDHARILDFGLAKLHDGPSLTVGMAVGTPSYMAPEQTLEEGIIDGRTDIYAVGLLFFEMLTGRKPYVTDNVAELLLMQQRHPAPRMGTDRAGAKFSDALEAFVAKALAKASGDRFASADEMAEAMDHLPESAAMHAGTAATVVMAAPADAGTSAGTDSDKTLSDKTLVDSKLVSAAALALEAAKKPKPEPRPRFWKAWSRRRRWLVAATVGATLAGVGGLVLLSSHKATKVAAPRKALAAPTAPVPSPADELSPMGQDDTPGLADAAQLVRLGVSDQAITVLQDIRRNYPLSAYTNFLLAVTYFDKMWWSIGREHAQAAMNLDPAYRRSPKLAKLFIRSLMSDSFWEKAAAILEQDLAEVAPTYLQEAAQNDRSARVRARAGQILASISGRPPVIPPTAGRSR